MNTKYIFFIIVVTSAITKPLLGMYITTKKTIIRSRYTPTSIRHRNIHLNTPCQKRSDSNKNNTTIESTPKEIDSDHAYTVALQNTIQNKAKSNNESHKKHSMKEFPFISRLKEDSLVRVECQDLIKDISSSQQKTKDLMYTIKPYDTKAQAMTLLIEQIGQAESQKNNNKRYIEYFIKLEQYLSNVHNNGEMIFKTRREYCKHIIKNKEHISLKNLYQNFPLLVPVILGSPCLLLPFLSSTSLLLSTILPSMYPIGIFIYSATEPIRIPTKIRDRCFMKLHETNRDLYNAIDKDAEVDKVFDLANILYEEWQKNQNNKKLPKPISIKKRMIKYTVDILKKYE